MRAHCFRPACLTVFFRRISAQKQKNRRQQLEEWQYLPATVILYEAPHRIEQVLQEVLEVWGDRQLAAARELTKLHGGVFPGHGQSVPDLAA